MLVDQIRAYFSVFVTSTLQISHLGVVVHVPPGWLGGSLEEEVPAEKQVPGKSGVRCAGCIVEKDLGTASGDRLRLAGLSLTVTGCGLWVPPVSEGASPRPLWPPAWGAAVTRSLSPPPCVRCAGCTTGCNFVGNEREGLTASCDRFLD